MVEKKYDIIIIGGGPAGVATWLYLNKYSPKLAKKTLLIEKETFPREKLCGGALGGWTEHALNYLNLEINIPSFSVNNLELRYGNDTKNIKEKNFFRIVRRVEFDHELIKAAINRGLKIQEGEYFQGFAHENDKIKIVTNKREYLGNILIGADGANSKVRQKMNLLNKPILAPGLEVFANADPQYDKEFYNNKAVIDFSYINQGLQGYLWHFPCLIDGKPAMNHGIIDFRINNNKRKLNLKNLLKNDLEKRNLSYLSNSYKGHVIPWISMKNILHKSNILLVGDAAGIEPAIGGGIHLAFSYGQIAAKKIAEAHEKNNYDFKDYELEINNCLLGKYISRLGKIAEIMYSNHTKILSLVKDIFDKNKLF